MKRMNLCYIEHENQWLMLLRNKKKNDINQNKWIGVGGKVQPEETPRQAMIREMEEETGLSADNLVFEGIVYFHYDSMEDEKIWVYRCTQFHGNIHECDEGTLEWIPISNILDLELWEGDCYFLKRIIEKNEDPFCFKLSYDSDGNLIQVEELEGEEE